MKLWYGYFEFNLAGTWETQLKVWLFAAPTKFEALQRAVGELYREFPGAVNVGIGDAWEADAAEVSKLTTPGGG